MGIYSVAELQRRQEWNKLAERTSFNTAAINAIKADAMDNLDIALQRALDNGWCLWEEGKDEVLEVALQQRSFAALEIMLKRGWDINQPRNWFQPPHLAQAIQFHDEEMISWFLAHNADPNARAGKLALTPLSKAVQFGSLDLVKLLFDKYGGSALVGDLAHWTCRRCGTTSAEILSILKYIHEKGAPIDDRFGESNPAETNECYHPTPLMTAIRREFDDDVVLYLLEQGADPEKYDLEKIRNSVLDAKGREDHRMLALLEPYCKASKEVIASST